MILRRITSHVKGQHWFAVFLDFFIVVAGILIAFQITNWNQARTDNGGVAAMRVFREFSIIVMALVLIAPVTAQADTGNIRVSVSNDDGRPLAGVFIVVSARDGETWRGATDSAGVAVVGGLESGLYSVAATREGLLGVVEPSLRVVRDKTVPLRLRMRAADAGIEEIVVVAEATQIDRNAAVSESFYDRESLRTAVGSGADVLRALDGLPGLVSTGEFASFTVRGRGPRDNLILVDGIPYDKVVHFDESLGEQEDINGGGRFSIFPPTLIEGAKFSPGGWGATYGGRNGSLLQLDVARGNPTPSASLRIDLAGYEVIYDGPSGFDKDTSLIFTARRFDFGQFFETIDELDIGSPVLTDVILKTHTQLNPSNELEFLFLYTPETYDRGVENVLASDNLQERELIDTEQDSSLLGITWTSLIGDDARLENRLYYRKSTKLSREGEAFPFTDPGILPATDVPVRENILTLEEGETEIGWRSDLSASNRIGDYAAGLRLVSLDLDLATTLDGDWIRYVYDADDFRPDPDQRYIVLTPADTNAAFDQSELQYAAYFEQDFNAGRWDYRVGVRYDYDGLSEEGYVSPRFGANARLSPSLRLSLTAGTFFQSPRFLDRAADPSNFALQNEKTNHFSIGLKRQFGDNWDVLFEAYYQQLRDLVTPRNAVTGLASNDGEGESYGFDVVVNRRFADKWSANLVYSHNQATLDDNDGEGEYDAPFNYENLLSIGARWELTERWMVGFRWKYATGRPRDDFIIYDDVLAGTGGPLRFSQENITNGTLRWDDFNTLNVRADYRRPLGPVDFIAFLDILNVLGSSASDEREFNSATGELKLDDEGPTPLIGIRFEKTWQ